MQPILVLVGGLAGSGKTTLGRALAQRLELPVLSRDLLKAGAALTLAEPLDAHRPQPLQSDIARGGRAGRVGIRALLAVATTLVDHGISFGVEQSWSARFSTDELRPIVQRCRAVQIHCTIPRELAIDRFAARRHRPSHPDAEILAAMRDGSFDWDDYDRPLELGVLTLNVDTSDGYRPSLAEIERFVWRSTS